jgi:hypothetical protein
LLGSQPLGLLLAALGAYCGAFFYILIHPVFFVFAYAPWILLAAVKLLDVQARDYFRWGLVWLLVNFACFNAGFVEVAVILIAGLNLAALIHALLGCRARDGMGNRIGTAGNRHRSVSGAYRTGVAVILGGAGGRLFGA